MVLGNIKFKQASFKYQAAIFNWLAEPHIKEFWDNSQAHKDDIVNFIEGRKTPSSYCDGKMVYWIGFANNRPFALLMSEQLVPTTPINKEKLSRLSKTGHTYGLDFMIGEPDFFGKGYGAQTLSAFIDFFRSEFDPKADTFLIDPADDNPRAKHIYIKAGFQHVCDFVMEGNCSGRGKEHHLLIKKFEPTISIVPATLDDYSCVQNMACFYVYDRTKYMGWECPENGMFECIDFKHYFENKNEYAFLVRVNGELAGFVLLNKQQLIEPVDWNMGEFFILAKFQGQGIAAKVAEKIFSMHSGKWTVAVMPGNLKAVNFWRKVVKTISANKFTEVFKTEYELKTADNPDPYAMNILSFVTVDCIKRSTRVKGDDFMINATQTKLLISEDKQV